MKYNLEQTGAFKQKFRKLDKSMQKRITKALEELRHDPYGDPNVKIARGKSHKGIPIRRLRVGNYRIFFSITDQTLLILLLDVRKKTGKSTYRF